jgi:hypothetical protein
MLIAIVPLRLSITSMARSEPEIAAAVRKAAVFVKATA